MPQPNKSPSSLRKLEVRGDGFRLDGKPLQLRSGEIHFSRVPRPYWRHRLQAAKAMGLNTVCAYLFWNVHEPRPGKFDFKGQADAAAFVRLAGSLGLHVILRPGPYACAEWDFGGLPAWLLKNPDARLRCDDRAFTDAAKRYLKRVGKELAPLQSTRGGPILLVQVENEYGSYGSDRAYMETVRDSLRRAGFDTPLFTCDGPESLAMGGVEGAFPVINFGENAKHHLKVLKKFSPNTPAACGEYYPGWFDHWGRPHQTKGTDGLLKEMDVLMDEAAMFSIYMFHGGTSFGLRAGANVNLAGEYMPQTTSYDYDAPLDEAGAPTAKYFALRALIAKKLAKRGSDESAALPAVPATSRRGTLEPIRITQSAGLFEALKDVTPIRDIQPRSMESYGQNEGFILYRARMPAGRPAALTPREVRDYALVFADGKHIGTIDRRLGQKSIEVGARARDQRLDILVEAMGRVNYGAHIIDRKGVTERVDFYYPYMGVLMGWEIFPLPMDAAFRRRLVYQSKALKGPAFHRGTFDAPERADTFLDMRGWDKGCVWVNGRNLGRYWRIGPQQTLYLPGCWLKAKGNEIVIFDLHAARRSELRGLKQPVLDGLATPTPD